jgi:hypothetical protein
MGNLKNRQSFDLPCRRDKQVPKSVAFVELGQVIIAGSDHGKAYMYDLETGKLRQTLRHDKRGKSCQNAKHLTF